jgi:hypothetical protein
MVTSKPRMIFSRLSADAKATGFSRYAVYFFFLFLSFICLPKKISFLDFLLICNYPNYKE